MRHYFFVPFVLLKAKKCGKGLKVNGWTRINNNVFLGTNVNFNGLSIEGRGKVAIGDNFHSGTGCLLITQTHDYDDGEGIPQKFLSTATLTTTKGSRKRGNFIDK